MRSIGCIIVLLVYCAIFDLCMIELKLPYFAVETCKMTYCVASGLMVIFCLIDSRYGFESNWHAEFNMICYLALAINFFIMALGYESIISDTIWKLIISNGSIFVASVVILIFGKKHNLFED